MKTMQRLLALVAALALCCCCAAAETAPEDVLATVNGTAITRGGFEGYLTNLANYYAYYGYDTSSAESQVYLKHLTMNMLVQMTLMDQKLAELGVELTEAERTAAEREGCALWVEDVSNAMTYYGVTESSTEMQRASALVQVLTELEEMGYTEESYVADAVENALYLKLEETMVAGAVVYPGEVEAYYDQLVAADRQRYADDAAAYESARIAMAYGVMDADTGFWYIPEGYRTVTHILLAADEALLNDWADLQATYEEQQGALEEGGEITDEAVTAEEVENARLAVLASVQTTVQEISSRLAAGESFADLIPLYTADAAMDTAEEIAQGYQVHMDSIFCPPGYRSAAFELTAPGEVSQAFVADGGVYILCYVEDAEGGAVPLTTELHAQLRERLLDQAREEAYDQTMAAWEAEAEIVFSEEAQAFMSIE